MRVIIAAAGTAGHINPGIAIANKIIKEDKNSEIIFLGTVRGLENDLVPRAGFVLKTIEAYGIQKKITLSSIKQNIKTLKGFGEAKKIIKEFKPDVVIGTGGYICGAAILAANKYNIPTILHESNAYPGKAVKILAKKTNTILVSFEDAKHRIKNAKNVVLTGTPIKIKKINYSGLEKEKILKDIGLKNNVKTILVFGGSQGAKNINLSMLDIIKKELNKNYQIIWAAGPKQYDGIKEEISKFNKNIDCLENTKIVPYIYNMEEIMNIADLIIARSGAMTVTELSALSKASILIPLPNVSNNHQMYNAKVLEKVGATKIIEDDRLTGDSLNISINTMLKNNGENNNIGINANRVYMENSIEKIYTEIKKIVK